MLGIKVQPSINFSLFVNIIPFRDFRSVKHIIGIITRSMDCTRMWPHAPRITAPEGGTGRFELRRNIDAGMSAFEAGCSVCF